MSGSGISWAICKSASRSRQITIPVSHAGYTSCQPTNSIKALKANDTHPSDHSHLCLLKCHLFFFLTGHVSLPCNMLLRSLHTTTVQPSSHNQRHVLIGKQWYQLPELIPTNSNSGLHSCISISIHTQHVT